MTNKEIALVLEVMGVDEFTYQQIGIRHAGEACMDMIRELDELEGSGLWEVLGDIAYANDNLLESEMAKEISAYIGDNKTMPKSETLFRTSRGRVEILRWGADDYSAEFIDEDYSVRGTFRDVIAEIEF